MRSYIVFFETNKGPGVALTEAANSVIADRKVGRYLAKRGHRDISIELVQGVRPDPNKVLAYSVNASGEPDEI